MERQYRKIAFFVFGIMLLLALIGLAAISAGKTFIEKKDVADEQIVHYESDTYHVTFYDSDGGDSYGTILWQADVPAGYTLITEGTPSDENKTFIYEGEIPTRTGYIFDKWISDTGSYTISSDTNFIANYKADDVYMINVLYKYSNGNIAADTYVITAKYNESYKIDIPVLDGYTADVNVIEGTITEEFLEELNNQENVEIEWIDSEYGTRICKINYTVTYNPAPSSYTVNYYKQNTSGDGCDLDESITYDQDVYIGDIVTAEGREYEGFHVNTETSIFETSVKADGKTELNIYADRDVYYIYYQPSGGTYYEPQPVLYGATIEVVEDPVRDGYRFESWTWYENLEGDPINKPSIMGTYNLYAVANWIPVQSHYSIAYYVQNADDDQYTTIGETQVDAMTESTINVSNLENIITDGFRDCMGQDEYMYYSYNEEETIKQNVDTDLVVNGDGSTVIRAYYDRNIYTLTFRLGTVSRGNYGIYTNGTSTTDVSDNNVYLNKNGQTYSIDTDYYTITARYGADIAEEWPTIATSITPESIETGGDWWGGTTYYPYGWNFRKSGSSSWTTQVSGIYTLNKDLLVETNDGYEGNEYYLLWQRSESAYTVHYMFETLDGSGTAYSGSNSYYRGYRFAENETYQTKISSTSMSYKVIDGFNYDTDASSERSGSDIYLYYLRNTYTLTFYNVAETILPDLSNIDVRRWY